MSSNNQAPIPVNNEGNNQAQQQEQQPPQQQFPKIPLGKIIMGYMFINFIVSQFASPGNPVQNPYLVGNLVQDSELFDLEVDVMKGEQKIHTWEETDITYDFSFANLRQKNITLNFEELQTKPYPYVAITLKSKSREQIYFYNETEIVKRKEMKKQESDRKNLLFDDEETQAQREEKKLQKQQKILEKGFLPNEIIPHYRPRIYIYFIKDQNVYNKKQMPPPFQNMKNRQVGNATYYEPFIDTTQWWLREAEYKAFNETEQFEENKNYTIEFTFDTYWSFKFMMQNNMQQSTKMYEDMGIETGGEDTFDMIKEMLVENNPYFLALTFTVSLLHSVFEFLAMKNDVMFWRNLKCHQGISVRSLYTEVIMEIIVFLYLLDSDEETSMMILIPAGLSIGISIWKLLTTSEIRKSEKFPYYYLKPKQDIYINTTERFDKVAVKWMYILLFPCFIAYVIYSLYNDEHKGWYSFALSSLVGFIYLFGFINMTPQLYINYKLKSVDHLPWRTMTYKFLNTIVDDFFAFAITMPWLKRLSCFRDDIIFVIYMYQRYIYKVDRRRTEHGFVKDELVPTNPQQQKKDQ